MHDGTQTTAPVERTRAARPLRKLGVANVSIATARAKSLRRRSRVSLEKFCKEFNQRADAWLLARGQKPC
jgi:hypothetical protein